MAKSPGEKAGLWSVRDSNAKVIENGEVVPRVHEPIPGTSYALKFNEWTPMPESHARVFLRDAAFEVRDAGEQPVRSMTEISLQRALPTAVLPPENVIANLDELTTESLVTRAAMKPGGNRFSSASGRAALISFLIGAEVAAQSGRRYDASAAAGDPSLDEMEDADAAAMLERELSEKG